MYCRVPGGQWGVTLLTATLMVISMATHARAAKNTQQKTIRIGGLFEHHFAGQELAFRHAIEKINTRRDLLPHIRLAYDIQQAPRQDSFVAAKKVCRQMRDGVAAIFGPMSSLPAAHIQSICDALEMPHIETRWDYSDHKDFFSINLYPHYTNLSRAFIDFIVYSKWTSFTILYENNDGLVRLQELLKAQGGHTFSIIVRRLEQIPEGSGDYRPVLKELRNRGESKIILDCDYTLVHDILFQAMTINMTTQYYHYFPTTLDLGLVDLEDFKYGGTNITGFRLVDPSRPEVVDIINDWEFERKLTGRSPLESERGFRTETALMFDAVHLFAKALDELSRAQDVHTSNLSCNKAKPWNDGSSLINYMKMTQIDGLTGPVRFDHEGRRSDFALHLVELTKDGLTEIGTWDPIQKINVTKDYVKSLDDLADTLKNKTLIVTTIMEDPYMMEKADKTLKGNDRFEGYCVDMLREIAVILKFNYTIRKVGDGKYGAPEADGKWNGMVAELVDRKADLAVASLTISYVREQVIDFTKPFMNLGISILFRKPDKQNPSLFSFLAPLSFEIWIYVMAAYTLVSFMLFVLARFSPYEWYNPHPCNPDSDIVENQFTLANSLWFTIGSLMQQGSEVAPRAMSTRLVSGIWWFFTLIIISSYTANLAAFLTVERMSSPIESADDLAKQTDIRYGTIYGGSTMTFFKTSKIPTYARMWNFMESFTDPNDPVFPNSTKVGVEWVKHRGYAYLLESTMNEYITQRDCELMQVGGLLDSKGYGIGTPMGSPYRDLISDAILKLQEDQILQVMFNKWWKEKGGGGRCTVDEKNKKDANALAMTNVGGVFVVLVAGLLLALIVGVLEFVYKSHRNQDVDRVHKSVCAEMCEELRFAVKCGGSSTKPAVKKRHRHPDHMIDGNGMTLTVPLTGYQPSYQLPNHSPGGMASKEMYT